MPDQNNTEHVQIDIVSDVVCPWCIVGYRQLCLALAETGVKARVRWHPFELNPDMPPEGQNLREHIIAKYGVSPEQSETARDHLTAMGAKLGFTFNFNENSRMVNTFLAHQLVEWSEDKGRQMDMKLALFKAHFTDGLDVSEIGILADVAAGQGLDPAEARNVLESGDMAWNVRAMQKFWIDKGVKGVPAMVFDAKHLLTGAQGAEAYAKMLKRSAKMAAQTLVTIQ